MKLLKISVFLILGVLIFSSQSSIAINLDHGDDSEFELPEIYVEDQPMVDNLVMVSVKFDHMAFVMVHEINADNSTGGMLGHAHFMIPSGHNHSMASLDMMTNPYAGGVVIHTLVKLPDSAKNTRVRAMLVNDTNMNHMLEMGTDMLVMKDGKGLIADFTVTDSLETTIEVVDQEISVNNPRVLIKKTIVPGHAWQVIHEFKDGGLGALFGRPVMLEHGVNEDIVVDLSLSIGNMNFTEGEPMKLWAHLHHDNFERGIFDPMTDGHVYSPNFDDPVIGNDSAEPFMATFGTFDTSQNDTSAAPLDVEFVALGLLVTPFMLLRKRK